MGNFFGNWLMKWGRGRQGNTYVNVWNNCLQGRSYTEDCRVVRISQLKALDYPNCIFGFDWLRVIQISMCVGGDGCVIAL